MPNHKNQISGATSQIERELVEHLAPTIPFSMRKSTPNLEIWTKLRNLHREYANLAWREGNTEATLRGLVLQLEAAEIWNVDLDRAAEQRILSAIAREIAHGFHALKERDPRLAWLLPYILLCYGDVYPAVYVEEIPGMQHFMKQAELAWRIPPDFNPEKGEESAIIRKFFETWGNLIPLDERLKHMPLSEVFSLKFDLSFQVNVAKIAKRVLPEDLEDSTGDNVAAFDDFRKYNAAANLVELADSAITLLQGLRPVGDPWTLLREDPWRADASARLTRASATLLALIDRLDTEMVEALYGPEEPGTGWPVVILPAQAHKFIVQQVFPNRETIASLEQRFLRGRRNREGVSANDLANLDFLTDFAVRRFHADFLLRWEEIHGPDSPGHQYACELVKPFDSIISILERSRFSLSGWEARRRRLGARLVSEQMPRLFPTLAHHMREAYRCFLAGHFASAILMARATIEVAAQEFAPTIGVQVESARANDEASLAKIREFYTRHTDPRVRGLARHLRALQITGNRVAHPMRGNVIEFLANWNEDGALAALTEMKRFLEGVAALATDPVG